MESSDHEPCVNQNMATTRRRDYDFTEMRRIRPVMIACCGMCCVAVAAPLQAQSPPPSPSSPPPAPRLKSLDQSVEDTGPLSRSFRVPPTDLRGPSGFQQVYRVPGQEELLMRGSGELFAVFPYSSYLPTRRGLVPTIPAGTVFYIGLPMEPNFPPPVGAARVNGQPPAARTLPPDRAQYDQRISTQRHDQVESRVPEDVAVMAPPALSRPTREAQTRFGGEPAATVLTDETYRAQRIGELLSEAAKAYRTRKP
jgi:hypothetical protein